MAPNSRLFRHLAAPPVPHLLRLRRALDIGEIIAVEDLEGLIAALERRDRIGADDLAAGIVEIDLVLDPGVGAAPNDVMIVLPRSEEHTSELQSLMRTSYAAFCLKKKIPII